MAGVDPGIFNLIIFVLAVFVGCYTTSSVAPAMHQPLTAMTSTLSGILVVGALIAAGAGHFSFSTIVGFLAIILAAINIIGGFVLTQRVLPISKKQQ